MSKIVSTFIICFVELWTYIFTNVSTNIHARKILEATMCSVRQGSPCWDLNKIKLYITSSTNIWARIRSGRFLSAAAVVCRWCVFIASEASLTSRSFVFICVFPEKPDYFTVLAIS